MVLGILGYLVCKDWGDQADMLSRASQDGTELDHNTGYHILLGHSEKFSDMLWQYWTNLNPNPASSYLCMLCAQQYALFNYALLTSYNVSSDL